ncbi:MAG: spore cortex biosynthesis protein YabQ [Lachnospiraceae bacterium]|nr:spore cortex biosynthesis protein YabQ [Lachnospiraceae bacterium]
MAVIQHSFYYFLMTAAYGFTIWSAYCCLCALRDLLKIPRYFHWIGDPLFWSIASLMTFQMMYRVNEGAVRGYSILGLVLGMSISALLVSRINKRCLRNEKQREKNEKKAKKKSSRLPKA